MDDLAGSRAVTAADEPTPDATPSFVVTIKFDAASFARLQSWRQRFFPAERNFIPAHLTLLHRLEPDQVARLLQGEWRRGSCPPVRLAFCGVTRLGRGVAIEVASPGLVALHGAVVAAAGGVLTAQDRQRFRPHVTVQNKVSPERALATAQLLERQWASWDGTAEAVLVWRYLGGPWHLVHELPLPL